MKNKKILVFISMFMGISCTQAPEGLIVVPETFASDDAPSLGIGSSENPIDFNKIVGRIDLPTSRKISTLPVKIEVGKQCMVGTKYEDYQYFNVRTTLRYLGVDEGRVRIQYTSPLGLPGKPIDISLGLGETVKLEEGWSIKLKGFDEKSAELELRSGLIIDARCFPVYE